MKGEQAWQAALGQLQLEMPKAAFDTWVANTEFISYEDGFFIIGAPNAYARDWLENRLVSTVTRLLTGLMSRSVEVNFVVWQQPAPNGEVREVYEEEEESSYRSPRTSPLTHATTSKILWLAHITAWRMPHRWRSPNDRRRPIIRCSCTAESVWGRHTCCMPSETAATSRVCRCFMFRPKILPTT